MHGHTIAALKARLKRHGLYEPLYEDARLAGMTSRSVYGDALCLGNLFEWVMDQCLCMPSCHVRLCVSRELQSDSYKTYAVFQSHLGKAAPTLLKLKKMRLPALQTEPSPIRCGVS